MKHNLWYWVIFIILSIWQLPQFLIAIIILPFMGNKKLIADGHYNLCWACKRMSGGISLGPFCYISETANLSNYRLMIIAHEFNGHTIDSKIFGPLYLLVIGIPSILNAICGFVDCYYEFYCEKWANNHAGLEIDKYCGIIFKDEESKNNIEKYLV